MFEVKGTTRKGGFVLWGSYDSLQALRQFVGDVAAKSKDLGDEGIVMGLRYDLRKAYEGQRKRKTVYSGDEEITLFGVEQEWVTFIVQVGLLRTAMAYMPTTKFEQSQMFLLEHILEEAVKSALPAKYAGPVLDRAERLVGIQEDRISPILGSRVSYFLQLGSTLRKSKLADILATLNPLYESLFPALASGDASGAIDPIAFEGRGWDDIDNLPVEVLKL